MNIIAVLEDKNSKFLFFFLNHGRGLSCCLRCVSFISLWRSCFSHFLSTVKAILNMLHMVTVTYFHLPTFWLRLTYINSLHDVKQRTDL